MMEKPHTTEKLSSLTLILFFLALNLSGLLSKDGIECDGRWHFESDVGACITDSEVAFYFSDGGEAVIRNHSLEKYGQIYYSEDGGMYWVGIYDPGDGLNYYLASFKR